MTGRALTGYTSRWALLALTVALILGSLAAAMAATANLVLRPDGQVDLSDALQFGPDHTREDLLGHLQSSTDRWEVPYLLVRTGGQRVEIQEVQTDNYMILHFNEHFVGPGQLVVSGLPYGREGLIRWPIKTYGTTPGEVIIFADTALFDPTDPAECSTIGMILDAADRQGLVVMLSSGVGDPFIARDVLVSQLTPGRMHLSTHRGSANTVLRSQYSDRLNAYGVKGQMITATWRSAESASNAGLDVHYIMLYPERIATYLPEEGPPKRWKNVTIYRSAEEFLEHYGR
jgi:hypothetical protein